MEKLDVIWIVGMILSFCSTDIIGRIMGLFLLGAWFVLLLIK